MHVDYGYFEGDHLGKPYDIKLMRRLLTYARPYRLIIAFSIVLILLVTGFELLFPYLIKVAIDDHIVVSARKITLNPHHAPPQRILLDRYGPFLSPTGDPSTFFIHASQLREIEPRDLAAFQEAGLRSRGPGCQRLPCRGLSFSFAPPGALAQCRSMLRPVVCASCR